MNYEDMTNNELRAEIAERLGWTFHKHTAGHMFDGHVVDEWIAVDPSKRGHRSFSSLCLTKDAALKRHTPNWPEDCNAVFTLKVDGASLWYCSAYKYHDMVIEESWEANFPGCYDDICVKRANAARAWCEAWLLWQDAQEAE